MQIISLPISFLNQAWAFTTADKRSLAVHEIISSSGYLNVKHQLALHELTYFWAVDCSPSVISPSATSGGLLACWCFILSCAVVIATVIQNRDEVGCNSSYVLSTILFTGIHCLRDDFVELSIGVQVGGLTMSVYFSHFFFCIRKLLYDPDVLFHL